MQNSLAMIIAGIFEIIRYQMRRDKRCQFTPIVIGYGLSHGIAIELGFISVS